MERRNFYPLHAKKQSPTHKFRPQKNPKKLSACQFFNSSPALLHFVFGVPEKWFPTFGDRIFEEKGEVSLSEGAKLYFRTYASGSSQDSSENPIMAVK
ncbi:hypothetical protein NPIL_652661 [Nephila pilipes]|uniref:Uncharacterized protein n=1 Tax=Nephila pilipes TaxID=299642 RepID=A0A8X6T838_NEPPI|nr:hypothetical protein NPIL_652661 [Nephila pilipes]